MDVYDVPPIDTFNEASITAFLGGAQKTFKAAGLLVACRYVGNLSRVDAATYLAAVRHDKRDISYQVEVRFGDGKIAAGVCACQPAAKLRVCKHVGAVLLGLLAASAMRRSRAGLDVHRPSGDAVVYRLATRIV